MPVSATHCKWTMTEHASNSTAFLLFARCAVNGLVEHSTYGITSTLLALYCANWLIVDQQDEAGKRWAAASGGWQGCGGASIHGPKGASMRSVPSSLSHSWRRRRFTRFAACAIVQQTVPTCRDSSIGCTIWLFMSEAVTQLTADLH